MTFSATSSQGLETVPLRGPLSAKYSKTFAYATVKDRMPVILCKVVDHLYRERINIGQERGPDAQEGIKSIIEELSRMRYEMQTNKELVKLDDDLPCVKLWNDYLSQRQAAEGSCKYYTSAWLWVECYMYRRLYSAVAMVPSLRTFDYFGQQKQEGFYGSIKSMRQLGAWLLSEMKSNSEAKLSDLKTFWCKLLQISLWGNKCDLSISAGSRQTASGDPVSGLEALSGNILCDHSLEAWQCLLNKNGDAVVHVVMDNAGFELFTDLCLADFLVSLGVAKKVRLRIKEFPWFVSDTTQADLTWTLNQLATQRHPQTEPLVEGGPAGQDNTALVELAHRWRSHLDSGTWTVHSDPFWTYPHDYSQMEKADPQLYADLAEADLVIFKGDLNYRKLVGDLNWETTVPFSTSLQGFLPSNVLAVRTLKADVVAGLRPGQAEETYKADPNWMVTGNWGLIQLASYVAS